MNLMIQKGIHWKNSRVLILGITFKENCPDIRNSQVADVYNELVSHGIVVDVHDPYAEKEQVKQEFNIDLIDDIIDYKYSVILFIVAHDLFLKSKYQNLITQENIIFDLKGTINSKYVDATL